MSESSIAYQEHRFLKDLSACFMQPTLNLAKAIASGQLANAFSQLIDAQPQSELADALSQLSAFSDACSGHSEEEIRILLEVEYNRLFVGPDKLKAPPYESYYRTDVPDVRRRTIKGPAEQEAKAFYRTFGLVMPDEFVEMADHICVELDFLSYLNLLEDRALKQGNEPEVLRIREGYITFLRDHLCKWINPFAHDVLVNAQLPFYPALVCIVKNTVLTAA